MDRIESLTNTLSQITMYDIKNMYNQAKNVVLNVSEMEAKVRDATNDEPWGASSTLMQEIAQGTFNFQNFNEIMPCIYARFMEKEAKQWRQIYKALQLLEYLIKNGSERVVDDARSHIATIKMLRNFYYIDEKGKDQGLNVRNRSRELVELLADVDKIRAERRKAKVNKNKYTGVGNDGMSFGGSGGRFAGFGSDSFSSGSGSGYGGGSSSFGRRGSSDYNNHNNNSYNGSSGSGRDYDSYSGGGSSSFRDSRKGYEEYDAGDDDTSAVRRSNSLNVSGSLSSPVPRRSATAAPTSVTPTITKAPQPAPVVDLLGMDDDFAAAPAAPAPVPTAQPAAAAVSFDNDDDFGGFQDATAAHAPAPASNPLFAAAPIVPNPSQLGQVPGMVPTAARQQPAMSAQPLFGMLNSATTASPPPMNLTANRPPAYMTPTSVAPQNPMFSSQPIMAPSVFGSKPAAAGPTATTTAAPAKPASSGNFDDLWSMSLGSSSSGFSSKPAAATPAKSIRDLEKEKAQAGIWGSGHQQKPSLGGSGFSSFGAPSNAAPPPSSSGNGFDDLLF
ncbi:hypothetical protein NLI96_g7962 [Meripilus lineatus]|uniref:ENTH domain-containing protein n=1 Tax=Meripilus lineatus TaxID=2056292 RepID=A0AAD5YEE4_9APHY|nr:hypothetical protein NLI96_g7962 [Physisporinus lineatus]